MAIPPISNARVSLNLKAFNLLSTLRFTQFGMLRSQNQLATGLRFQTPSEDPTRATAALKLDRALDTLHSVGRNVETANSVLTQGEAAIQEAVDLMREAHTMALEGVNDVSTADERSTMAMLADSTLERLVSVANRKYLDTFLFSGRYGDAPPFELQGDGVYYRGDNGQMQTAVESDFSWDAFTVPGSSLFDAVSDDVRGWVDLNPQMTASTRISNLRGATGAGVTLGRVTIMQGSAEATIDLSGATTVGDIIDRLNAEMPAPLQASVTSAGINIAPTSGAGDILVVDIAGGRTAVDLGIFSNTRASQVIGADLNPRLTLTDTVAQLNSGTGVDLSSGITIRNGSRTAIITFSGSETIEDVLNRINLSNVGVWARISDDGNAIDVLNRVSGSDLRIEEFGGGTASALGIRSLHSGTRLANLNDGRGIDSVPGDDFRITTAGGATIDIDLDQVDLRNGSLQDVIDLINGAAGGAVSAMLTTNGNGIVLRDNTSGAGTFGVARLNLSPALDSLGLNGPATGNTLQGNDINPIRVDGPFTALLELRRSLEDNDTQRISMAGERIGESLKRMQRVQGELAAKAKSMIARADRLDNSETDTQIRRSDVADVDMTEAIVRFQQLQTALQANLQTASKVMSLSLMDYLR